MTHDEHADAEPRRRAFSLNASDGYPYMLTTGFDDNRDGLLNDRPPAWASGRCAAARLDRSLRLTYSLLGVPGPAADAAQRYKLSIYAASTT